MLECSRIRHLGLLFYGRQVLTEQLHHCTGPSMGSLLISLIPNESNIYYARRGLNHINVPYGHSYRPAHLKDHGREGVSSSNLNVPLMYHRLQSHAKSTLNPANMAAINTARSRVTILSLAVGEMQFWTNRHMNMAVKVSLYLFVTSIRMHHSIESLTIYGEVLCNTPLGGLSHIWLTMEPTISDQLPLIVKLCSEGIQVASISAP